MAKRTATRAAWLLLGLLVWSGQGATVASLAAGFDAPPHAARPWVYWFWMNGNLTREGITADLEAMARVGVGGVLIMSVSNGILPGPVPFGSDAWRALFTHAVREADRLGLSVNMNNDDGWTGSGGPWLTPEQSMQELTWSAVTVAGGPVDVTLPNPPAIQGYYRDVAVLALPGRTEDPPGSPGQWSSPGGRGEPATLADGDQATGLRLPAPSREQPGLVQVEYPSPVTIRGLSIWTGPGRQNHGGQVEASDDGVTFRPVRDFRIPANGINRSVLGRALPTQTARYWRLRFDSPAPIGGGIDLREVRFHPTARLDNWGAKTGRSRQDGLVPAAALPFESGPIVQREQIVDLTSRLKDNGRLTWAAPAGDWTIYRVGQTTTGKTNHPATPGGTGLECDKLDRAAVEAHFDGFLAKLIADVGPLAGKTLTDTHIDSWEVGSQGWTASLPEKFRARRGYDLRPWLPGLIGLPVDSVAETERVLWDLRRTLADLIAEEYVGSLREVARRHGLGLSIEAYGNGNFDNLAAAEQADIPMSEFWVGNLAHVAMGKQAASTAHQLGRSVVAAESFTAKPTEGKWLNHPGSLKALGDAAFAAGINRFVFHRWALQPWLDRWPGMTFGPHGIHYERTNTWFEPSRAWLQYLARCQMMLQSGTAVADLCYFIGESEPRGLPDANSLSVPPPPGFDYDGCSRAMLLQFEVVDGRLTLPSGMSYRALILPTERVMTVEVARKLEALVKAGAVVAGPRPTGSPSQADHPAGDAEVKRIAERLWGGGHVVSGELPADRLAMWPDVDCGDDPGALRWIHRRLDDGEVYFLVNPLPEPAEVAVRFRATGVAELWDPVTGQRRTPLLQDPTGDGRTNLALRLESEGAVFVVFREASAGAPQALRLLRDGQPLLGAAEPVEIEILSARYGLLDDPARTIDVTAYVAARLAEGARAVRVWSTLGGDPAPNVAKTLRVVYRADGERRVAEGSDGAEVRFPRVLSSPEPVAEAVVVDGQPRLLARQAGSYTVETAARPLTAEVLALPQPRTVIRRWNLVFEPGRGAPSQATFAELFSWPDSDDEGIRYFSGTATYTNTFTLPEAMVGDGRRVLLDLGRVEVMAEVLVNDQPLGILWHAPYEVDLTRVAKVGVNRLEVRVTNLWPNRLIGDERLAPYLKFGAGGAPAEWPPWLTSGGPVPATGRVTMTTWRHWQATDSLLPSGLLGPVRLVPIADVALR